jgi:lysophospholipase L1-like esterase
MDTRFHASGCLILCLLLSCTVINAQEQTDICFFGDSITEGWIEGEYVPEFAFPAITDSLLLVNGRSFTSVNLGAGGETTEDAIARIDHELLPRRPRVVLIAFGSNDLFIWGTPPFQRVPLQRFVANLRYLCRKIRGIGAVPLFMTLPPVLAQRFSTYIDSTLYETYGGIEALNWEYSDAIVRIAREEGVAAVQIDFAAGRDTLLGFDGVHPTAAGHRMIAQALLPYLSAALDSREEHESTLDIQVYPLPFQRITHARMIFSIDCTSGTHIDVSITDASGRKIRKFVYFAWSDGRHFLSWDGTSADGTPAAAGTYILSLRFGDRSVQQSVTLL